jgi:hypothetical protein
MAEVRPLVKRVAPRVALVGVVCLLAGLLLAGRNVLTGPEVVTVTGEEAARLVRREAGRARLVLLYRTTSPESRRLLPGFIELAERVGGEGVAVLALALDRSPGAVGVYMAPLRPPFELVQVRAGRPGEVAAALRPTGIELSGRAGVPLTALIDGSGRLVGQWAGVEGVERAAAALATAGIAR